MNSRTAAPIAKREGLMAAGQGQWAWLGLLWLLPLPLARQLPLPSAFHPLVLVLAFLAVVVNLQSRRVQNFGQVTLAHTCVLALMFWPSAGPAVALGVACLAGACRWALAGGGPQRNALEFFCFTVPVSYCGQVACHLKGLHPAVVPSVIFVFYSSLLTWLPSLWGSRLGVEWENNWRSWHPFQRGYTGLGIALGYLCSSHPWSSLFCLPLLLNPTRVVDSPDMESLRNLTARLERSQASLETVQRAYGQLEAQLRAKEEEFRMVQEVSTTLAQVQDFDSCCDLVLRTVQQISPGCSVVYFRPDSSGRLLPYRFQSRQIAKLQQFPLLELREPIVELAWKSRQMVCQASPSESNRVAPQEVATVALYLGAFGVLYAGRAQPEFRREECQLLRIFQDQATVAFYASSRLVHYKTGVAQLTAAHRRSSWWGRRRARLLKVCRRISEAITFEELSRRLGRQVGRVMAHRHFYLDWQSKFEVGSLKAPWAEVKARVGETGRPLLIPDLSRFGSGSGEALPVLAIPLADKEGSQGILMLVGRPERRWRRAHLQLLGVLALQLRSSLRQIELRAQISQAYSDLQISQAQLVQSSKMAAVGQLAAGIAHEINTPLAVISMGISAAERMMEQPGQIEKARQRLNHALGAVDTAESIIRRLLSYSREGSSGAQPTRLAQVAEDTLMLLAHHIKMRNVQIQRSSRGGGEVMANPSEIQQVVTNLLMNAMDAMAEQEPSERKLLLTSFERDQRGYLVVRDNGPGIPREIRDRIFEPFFTTKAVGQGAGLGLFVSTQIVERYGGKLELVDTGGRGCCFQVSLPLVSPLNQPV